MLIRNSGNISLTGRGSSPLLLQVNVQVFNQAQNGHRLTIRHRSQRDLAIVVQVFAHRGTERDLHQFAIGVDLFHHPLQRFFGNLQILAVDIAFAYRFQDAERKTGGCG
ncbi:hypothetical protein D3C80_1858270 [compost metagenome]